MSTTLPLKAKKQDKNAAFSAVLIKLLQGFVVSDEKKYWESLLIYQEAIRQYFSTIGLQLHLSTDDGYAFLKAGPPSSGKDGTADATTEGFVEEGEATDDSTEENVNLLPSLVRRSPLSFDVSLVCVLLREALEQFDSKVTDDHRLVLHRTDIYDLLRIFYEEKTDETKQIKRFDGLINRVIELGFLKELKGNQNSFEVRRMIKAQFDAEKLSEIKVQMRVELGLQGAGE
jgi:hypothetical protein